MTKVSAGILLYRHPAGVVEVFLVHPGGPFWARKDDGAWSIPKGEVEPDDDPLARAKREFTEETGLSVDGDFRPLAPVRQVGGKTVHAWAVRGDADETAIKSNSFNLEWPPHSGRMQEFPEVDRAQWFDMATARRKLNPAQRAFVDALEHLLRG